MMNRLTKINFPLSILIVVLFVIPNNSSNNFNGLPLSSHAETLVLLLFLPLFIFFEKFKKFKKSILVFSVILIFFKLASNFFIPNSGVIHKFQRGDSNPENLKTSYIKTFDSIWHQEASGIQNRNWNTIWDFPIDWTFRHHNNVKKDKKFFKNYEEFINQRFYFESVFVIPIFDKSNFSLILGDFDNVEIIIEELYSKKKITLNTNDEIKLNRGLYRIETKILFTGDKWKFNPVINNSEKSLFKKNIIFQDHNYLNKIQHYKTISIYITFFDYIVLLFMLFVFVYLIIKSNIYYIRTSFSFFFLSLLNYFLLEFLFKTLNVQDGTKVFFLGFSIFLWGAFHVIYFSNKKNYNFIFLSILPTVIFYFAFKNFENLDVFKWWSPGDDWEIFRVFARDIAVDNNWINMSESEYRYRPGIRYFFALSHYIFGKSSFVDSLLEVYGIIFAAFLLFKIMINFKIETKYSFIFTILLLVIFFSTNYRWLVGRGLTEYYALFNIMLILYLFSLKKEFKYYELLLIGILGGIGTWLREDHLPLILSLILFKDFIHNKNYTLRNFIFNIFEPKKLFYYFTIVLIFTLLLIKNKYYLGTWGLLTQEVFYNNEIFGNPYFRMFFAVENANQKPAISSIFLILGTVISLIYFIISILRKNNFSHTIFFIAIFCILFPFLFVNNVTYAPRYTITFLCFCILPIAYFTNQQIKIYFKN